MDDFRFWRIVSNKLLQVPLLPSLETAKVTLRLRSRVDFPLEETLEHNTLLHSSSLMEPHNKLTELQLNSNQLNQEDMPSQVLTMDITITTTQYKYVCVIYVAHNIY